MGHMPPHRCERSGLSPRLWKCMTQEGSLKPRKAVVPCSWEICPSSLCGNVYVPDKMRPLHPGGTPALGVAWKEGRSVFKEKGAYLQMPLWTRLCLHFLRSPDFYSWECSCLPSKSYMGNVSRGLLSSTVVETPDIAVRGTGISSGTMIHSLLWKNSPKITLESASISVLQSQSYRKAAPSQTETHHVPYLHSDFVCSVWFLNNLKRSPPFQGFSGTTWDQG